MAIKTKKIISKPMIQKMVSKGERVFKGKGKSFPLAKKNGDLLITHIELKVGNDSGLNAVITTAAGNKQMDYDLAKAAKRQVMKYRKIAKARLPKITNPEIKLAVQISIQTGIRPGGQGCEGLGLFDLTTNHVKMRDGLAYLVFKGKAGVEQDIMLNGLSGKVLRLRRTRRGGEKLFQVKREQVNKMLGKLNLKDLRTRLANDIAKTTMKGMELPTTKKEFKAAMIIITEAVAARLGHKKGNGDLNLGTSKKSYINPELFQKLSSKVKDREKILTKKEREILKKGSMWERRLLPVKI